MDDSRAEKPRLRGLRFCEVDAEILQMTFHVNLNWESQLFLQGNHEMTAAPVLTDRSPPVRCSFTGTKAES